MTDEKRTVGEQPVLRILLLWHSLRSGNLGVGALTLGHIEILKRAAAQAGRHLEIDIAGWGRELDYRNACPELGIQLHAGRREVFSPSSDLNRIISQADIVLDIGSGDSFSDLYGTRRFWAMSLVRLLVLVRRKPFVFAPQTVGPFKRRYNRWMAQLLLRWSTHVFARDGLSTQALRDLGITQNVTEAIDVAFRLPFQRTSAVGDTTKMKIGINISALLHHGGYQGSNQFGLAVDYVGFSRRLLSELSDDPNLEVHLIPHVVSTAFKVEDDYLLARTLHDEFPKTVLPPEFRDPMEAKSYISGLDLLIGSRMHATIAAFSSGVPVLPLAYSRKFKGLFESLGYSMIADLTRENEDEIMNRVSHACSHLSDLKGAVKAGNALADEKLLTYENYLTDFLQKIST